MSFWEWFGIGLVCYLAIGGVITWLLCDYEQDDCDLLGVDLRDAVWFALMWFPLLLMLALVGVAWSIEWLINLGARDNHADQ